MERIQKAAIKVMLGTQYEDYKKALKFLNMKSLVERRQVLSLKFAKNCLKSEKVKNFFPINDKHSKNTRSHEKFKVNFARTKRYLSSTVPSMQRLLNKDDLFKKHMLRRIGC